MRWPSVNPKCAANARTGGCRVMAVQRLDIELACTLEHALEERGADALPSQRRDDA